MYGFLQIPPHDGHPCLRLILPTAKRIADFHRQVTAHFVQIQIGAITARVMALCCFCRIEEV